MPRATVTSGVGSTATQSTTSSADRTTRYLKAAAHLDADFTNRVVDEYLSEPFRALPPSSGVDAAAVLQEAIAARRRHKARDSILLVLALAAIVISPVAFAVWLMFATLCRVLIGPRTMLGQMQGQQAWITRFTAFPPGLLLVLFGPMIVVTALAILVADQLRIPFGTAVSATSITVFLVLLTVASDRFIEWSLATKDFAAPGHWDHGRPWAGGSLARGLSSYRNLGQLEEVAQHGTGGNTVVFRGDNPFVGAGDIIDEAAFAIPLVPAEKTTTANGRAARSPHPDESAGVDLFEPTDVYQHVFIEFDKLKSSRSLSPSQRMHSMEMSHFVAAAAEEVLNNHEHPRSRWAMTHLQTRPNTTMTTSMVNDAANHPIEWMRCFGQFKITSWDDELVVTAFLHVGCDDRILYVEWTCCALFPLQDAYRKLDDVKLKSWRPPLLTLLDLVTFPATLPQRIKSALGGATPLRFTRPDKASAYGAQHSVREIASGHTTRSYFETADVTRYHEILRRHTLGAIAGFLDSRGLSSSEFTSRVMTLIDNSVNNFGINKGKMGGGKVNSPKEKPDRATAKN